MVLDETQKGWEDEDGFDGLDDPTDQKMLEDWDEATEDLRRDYDG